MLQGFGHRAENWSQGKKRHVQSKCRLASYANDFTEVQFQCAIAKPYSPPGEKLTKKILQLVNEGAACLLCIAPTSRETVKPGNCRPTPILFSGCLLPAELPGAKPIE